MTVFWAWIAYLVGLPVVLIGVLSVIVFFAVRKGDKFNTVMLVACVVSRF